MWFRRKRHYEDISPEEIFLDSINLPRFDTSQFEGRIEKPIKARVPIATGVIFSLILIIFFGQSFVLQIVRGDNYAEISENNRLRHSVVFAERGNVYDRNGTALIWNNPVQDSEFALRSYIPEKGFAHLLGYLSYPAKDSAGFFYSTEYEGVAGVESSMQSILAGQNGVKIIETNALNKIVSQSQIKAPVSGQNISLSIDERVQKALYGFIEELAGRVDFVGGSGLLMDIDTGELVAITNYPEYDPNAFSSTTTSKSVESLFNAPNKPFLNRAISGLFTPGSIVKPFVALGALDTKTVDPSVSFLSTGRLVVPNPYNPEQPSIFTDWRAHGWVDMRRAIAVSSNVYFYIIGGGFEDQKGLGINQIEKYLKLFGLGEKTGIHFGNEAVGVISNPDWKKENFDGEDWRLGDTYNTSIGQYGTQVSPIQVVSAVGAIASKGILVTPTVMLGGNRDTAIRKIIDISEDDFKIIHEGMRMGVEEGSAQGLSNTHVKIAAKTGTAELGSSKSRVNSWVIGFFPYDNPKYAFTILMESGPRANLFGGVSVMRQLVDWMAVNTPEYFK